MGLLPAVIANVLIISAAVVFGSLFALSEALAVPPPSDQATSSGFDFSGLFSATTIKNGSLEITEEQVAQAIGSLAGSSGVKFEIRTLKFDTDRIKLNCVFELPDNTIAPVALPVLGDVRYRVFPARASVH